MSTVIIQEVIDMLANYLVDNTVDVFEEIPEIDEAKTILEDYLTSLHKVKLSDEESSKAEVVMTVLKESFSPSDKEYVPVIEKISSILSCQQIVHASDKLFKEGYTRVDVMYRCGANFKKSIVIPVADELVKSLELEKLAECFCPSNDATIELESLGLTVDEFFTGLAGLNYNPEYDHNFVSIEKVHTQ